MGVALMTTLTFTMGPQQAILVLVCIYVGAIYGGSRSAILLNIPGTPASACSTLDGFPLARQGLAGRAMGISTAGSWLGTLFGILCVAALTPVLSEVALKFQSFEFFWIAVFGIVIAGTLSGGDPIKGYLAGFLGLLIATIGRNPTTTTSASPSARPIWRAASGCFPRSLGPLGLPRCSSRCAARRSRPSTARSTRSSRASPTSSNTGARS
jgi:putative tricarboxylic transport membrane protein